MLEVTDLHFDYQDKPLLNKVGFKLESGAILHLRGANGAGKTTLLRLIAGLLQPTQGQINYCAQNIDLDLPSYQQHICYIGHKTGINPYLTLKENCQFDLHYGANDRNFIELASVFNLDNYLDQPCGLLSAGQRRQVGLLRLWMTTAKLWLLDEPLTALDDLAQSKLMNQIMEHCKQGGSVILTSHQNLPIASNCYQEFTL